MSETLSSEATYRNLEQWKLRVPLISCHCILEQNEQGVPQSTEFTMLFVTLIVIWIFCVTSFNLDGVNADSDQRSEDCIAAIIFCKRKRLSEQVTTTKTDLKNPLSSKAVCSK